MQGKNHASSQKIFLFHQLHPTSSKDLEYLTYNIDSCTLLKVEFPLVSWTLSHLVMGIEEKTSNSLFLFIKIVCRFDPPPHGDL